MTNRISDISLRTAAIVAGVSILVMTIAAVVATDFVLGHLVVPGDAAATTGNIDASGMLFRAGVFSWIVVLICDVMAAWGLYVFLRPVNRSLSLIMAWVRLVYAAMLGAAVYNLVVVLLLVRGDYSRVFGINHLQAQVMLHLDAFDSTWSIGLVVFGIHILLLGYLAFKSGYVPRIFGVLLVIASFGYFIINSINILYDGNENIKTIIGWIFIIPMVVGEVGLGLWLLIRGVKVRLER